MENFNLNQALFVGIDSHPSEHTALMIDRFEEEQGRYQFENTKEGIFKFLCWLKTASMVKEDKEDIIVGIEGGGSTRKALITAMLPQYPQIYEVNPLYTKQRRTFGTRPDKSDPQDAKLIAEVLTKKLSLLPKIKAEDFSLSMFFLKKMVWFYEDLSHQATSLQNQLHQLEREKKLSSIFEEKEILSLIIKTKRQQSSKIKDAQKQAVKEMAKLLLKQGKNLTTIKGIKTVLAARIVAHGGGIERFANLDGFIRYAGIAPIERSSGRNTRHVKNNTGNRKLNSALYLAAMSQLRWNPKAKIYFDKKVKEGKTKKHALRCLMKRTACIIYGMLKGGGDYRG